MDDLDIPLTRTTPLPQEPLATGICAQLACIWEATARKPGNVHRYADFADTNFLDFLLSAAAIAPAMNRAGRHRLGDTVLSAVQATRRVVASNTNLGIILLLAPLARAAFRRDLPDVLAESGVPDAVDVYQAIRLAGPGGMGTVSEEDLNEKPTRPLLDVMSLAADRDLIARQYVNGFADVLEFGLPALDTSLARFPALETAIVHCHLQWMARHPDSLIQRKRGLAEAEEAARRAAGVLDAGWPERTPAWKHLADFDDWLRAEGNARNPGTSADLVTACLFIALREGTIALPRPFAWSENGSSFNP